MCLDNMYQCSITQLLPQLYAQCCDSHSNGISYGINDILKQWISLQSEGDSKV